MRRPEVLIAWILVAALAAIRPASADETDKLQQIERELAKTKNEARATKERSATIATELTGLRERLIAAAAEVQDAEQELARISTSLARLEEEERTKAADLVHRRHQTALTLAALQRLALRPPDALIAAPGTPLETVRGALLLTSAVPALTHRTQELREELENLARVRSEISQSKAALDRAANARSAAAEEIASLIEAKLLLLSQSEAASRKLAQQAAELAAQAEDVRDLLKRLAAERERAAAVEAQAPRHAEGEPPVSDEILNLPQRLEQPAEPPAEIAALGPQAVPLIENPTLVRPFPNGPGGLLMPARGRVTRRFDPTPDSGPLSKGVVIETLPGAQVIAPFDGHVVFQGPFRGYGAILIIEHTGGYHTLLSGLGRIDAAVGQWLLAGEPLGVMDSVGTPELYVELRRASQPIDPLPWLQISGDKVKG
ncbi:MAG TPA: peptidoglycan DD-metalloendopeptidase family protein [Alphaproteobacteria bacterium]|nr:peptidoglycan DD-metalloendopeptidase family protein [Alphaproteobacteria bacterium]